MSHPPSAKLTEVVALSNGERFSSAVFSKDGASVLTTSPMGRQRWSAETGEFLETLSADDEEFETYSDFAARLRASMSIDTEIKRAACERFRGFDDCAVTSPDERFVAIGSASGDLNVFDRTAETPMRLKGHDTSMNNHMHQNSISALLFDAGSRFLLSMAEEDDAPLLWDLQASAKATRWNDAPALLLDAPLRLSDVTPGGIDTLSFSPREPHFVATHRNAESAIVWAIGSTGLQSVAR